MIFQGKETNFEWIDISFRDDHGVVQQTGITELSNFMIKLISFELCQLEIQANDQFNRNLCWLQR